ncbi:MAG: hypothetical protein HRU70_06245 [Phycisphaeraceae bacterium]|nr:MAG: hypothetical protein HRU70_06245 [Phycisphaeraceae bacterium]
MSLWDRVRRSMGEDGGGGGGGVGPRGSRRRPAGLSLRGGEADEADGSSLDPANQSLADALRITLRLVQFGMVVLFALFALSGFQSVRENERAVRLVFGAVDSMNVEPGFRFSYPFPVGEMIRVDVGQAEVVLDKDFWPQSNAPDGKSTGIDNLAKVSALTPGVGGSLITSDENIAHTQWRVLYVRERPDLFAKNVLPELERELVASAVRRGVIRACSKVDIDTLLKQSGADTGSAAGRAKQIAQEQLDRLETGIRIQQLLMESVMPPPYLRERFNSVLTNIAEAGSTIERARSEASQVLASKAGGAVPYLRRMIDEYDEALREDPATAPVILAKVHAMLQGRPVEVDGLLVEGVATGEVSRIISEARRYRSEVVSLRKAEAGEFVSKLAQFKSDPELMVASEIERAVTMFMSRENVELIALPPGMEVLRLRLSRDPDVRKEAQERLNRESADRAKRERERMLNEERFKVKEGGGPVSE